MPHLEPVPADDLLTLSEAAVLLNLEAATITSLADGPFAPSEPGRITVRSLVGIYVACSLLNAECMAPGFVGPIAAEAAKGAADAGARSLLVMWKGRTPSVRWASPNDRAGLDDPITGPTLVLPVDQMTEELGCYLAALRLSHAMERPN